MSTPQTGGEVHHAAKPPPPPRAHADKAVEVAVSSATPLASPQTSRGNEVAGTPVAAATITDPGGGSGSGSLVVPFLVILAAGLGAGYACVRLWRLHERRRLDALWLQRDVTWEAAVHEIKTKRALRASRSRAERQKVDVG